jgi:hypothetical protein
MHERDAKGEGEAGIKCFAKGRCASQAECNERPLFHPSRLLKLNSTYTTESVIRQLHEAMEQRRTLIILVVTSRNNMDDVPLVLYFDYIDIGGQDFQGERTSQTYR